MPKFLIEREISGAGNLSAQEVQGVAQTSCSSVLQKPGPQPRAASPRIVFQKSRQSSIRPLLNSGAHSQGEG